MANKLASIIWTCSSLNPKQKLVLLALESNTSKQFPGVEALAEMTCIKRHKIACIILQFEAVGLLEWAESGGIPWIYGCKYKLNYKALT